MDYTWFSVLLWLNTLIYCGHSQEIPVAVLTLQPNLTQTFVGESVTLRCVIQGGGDTNWEYKWYKNCVLMNPYHSTSNYKVSPAYPSQSGSYTCMGVKGNKASNASDAVQLTVFVPPGSLLPRMLYVLLLVSPFFLASNVLMVKYCRSRGLCSSAKSPQDKLRSDYVNESSL
ncbi:hypothetical protein UPYG_G00236940 [Umbra pygmaea]|uniref:Ig-like domain-containing protein n=1 Tax=Umbra pygmaea TaxID=75934 RepID=A0ABD0WEI8_UMBPY